MTKIAVGFDFDRTLGLDYSLERQAFGELAEQFGVAIDIGEERTANTIEQMLVPFRLAEETMPAMLARFAATLPPKAQRQMLDFGLDAVAGCFRQICYDLVPQLVKPLDGAPECISRIVALGIPVGILTNGWSELQERKIAHALGDFPGPILVSDAIGAYKPSAQAFNALEKALDIAPEGLWYVGDNPVADIAGARAYGLRAVWLNREGYEYPAGLAEPTAVIERLAELPAIVRGA